MSQAAWKGPVRTGWAVALTVIGLVAIAGTFAVLFQDPPPAKRLNDLPLAERKAYFESLRENRAVKR